jgi:hypothetical protein
MKQIKNKLPGLPAALFFVILSLASCSKKSDPAPPVIPKPSITSFSPVSAYTGDVVTITGTNFTGATAVSFGGSAAASFTVSGATTITAVVGAGATGDVKVVTPGGSATLAGFTLNAPKIDGYNSSGEVDSVHLIAYWPFDGSLNEKLHSAAPVLQGGAQTFVDGRIGKAVHLAAGWMTYGPESTSAGADNTTFSSNDTLQNGFTVSVWAQVDPTDNLSNLFQLSVPGIPNWPILGLNYRKHADNSFDIDGGIGNVDGTGPHITYAAAFMEPAFFDSLDWAHIVMTYDGPSKTMKYYANGILRKSIDLAALAGGPFPDATASLLMITPNYPTIGTFESAATTPGDGSGTTVPSYMNNGINGNVDEIRFFNAALSEADVMALFHLGQAGR